MSDGRGLYLKRHTERLIKDVGYAAACDLTGRSKATLGRYFSEATEHSERFMPVDAVAALETASDYPHVTAALAELNGGMLSYGSDRRNAERGAGVNSDVIVLSQRFAILMTEYHQSIEDGIISINEARRLLSELLQLQKVLVEMKLKLEAESRV
jgi:GR25 family glycosyltransferase involved in LPS biosynthesis